MNVRTYLLSEHFENGIDISILSLNIQNNQGIQKVLDGITVSDGQVVIKFFEELSQEEVVILDNIISSYIYVPPPIASVSNTWQAIVSNDAHRPGDYTSISEAFSAGAKSVWVREGYYFETNDIIIPDEGSLYGESNGRTIIIFIGNHSMKIDGSGGVKEKTGNISIDHNTSTVIGDQTNFTTIGSEKYILISNYFYYITSVIDDTHLTIGEIYTGVDQVNEPYVIQSLYTCVKVKNIVIRNSSGTGLYIRGVRFSVFEDLAIADNGTNITIIDSSNCSFRNGLISQSNDDGAIIDSCSNISFLLLIIYNNKNGLKITDSKCIIVNSCRISSNIESAVTIEGESTNINICKCDMLDNYKSGVVTGSDVCNIIVNNCNILKNKENGVFYDCCNSSVINNFINYNGSNGIICGDSTIIQGNQIKENIQDGINTNGRNNCVINSNNFYKNNGNGIKCSGNNNTITSNRSTMNTQNGLLIDSTSENTIVSTNNLSGNTGQNLTDNGIATLSSTNVT